MSIRSVIFVGTLTAISFTHVLAAKAKKEKGHEKEKRHAHAHVHGQAKLSLAIDGNKLAVTLESPGESIVGFEHEAKTDAQKKQQEDALNVLKTKITEIVVLDASLGCKVESADAKVGAHEGEHSEVNAAYVIACAKPLAGTNAQIDFTKLFPKLHEINLSLASPSKASTKSLTPAKGTISF